jgi:hypothetical protein
LLGAISTLRSKQAEAWKVSDPAGSSNLFTKNVEGPSQEIMQSTRRTAEECNAAFS